MAEPLRHLELRRLDPVTERRRGTGFAPKAPADPRAHAASLTHELHAAATDAAKAQGGFDPRLLLKLDVDGLSDPEVLEEFDGLQLVSHEGKRVVVVFASNEGLTTFRERLALVMRGEQAKRQDILFAVKGASAWTRFDRTGPALRDEGVATDVVRLDVELWALERRPERAAMRDAFRHWCHARAVRIVDQIGDGAPVVLYRIVGQRAVLDELLEHRDVRLVDLPPRYALRVEDVAVPLASLAPVPEPPADAASVVVLDSGIASNHPVLAPAVGDAQTFLDDEDAADGHGHGTRVAAIALYGDVATCIDQRAFVPRLRVFSGKVTNRDNEADDQLLENSITNAVEYFVTEYGARIFNLSVGDLRKPYLGGHVRGLAATVDALARQHKVLFVVSAGNYKEIENDPPPWREAYPRYLLERPRAHILDPAPALNALTVGSLARYEAPAQAQRYPDDVAFQAVARRDEPSPFTTSGPGAGGAIKPDVVAYGGNYAVDARTCRRLDHRLGEVSANRAPFGADLFTSDVGTSYAAPKVAHLAARLAGEYPDASPDLLRALVVAHARVPTSATNMGLGEDNLRRLVGYGMPLDERAIYSSQQCVSLLAEDELEEDQSHFYELPLPEDFLRPGRRPRAITVAVAHTPQVRTTRADYRASRLQFRVVRGTSLEGVTAVFRRTAKNARLPMLSEFRESVPVKTVRDKGTVQAGTFDVTQVDATWATQKLFVVVSRAVPSWAANLVLRERYALVITIEERQAARGKEQESVRYYTQLQQRLRARARVRR
jgi:hypothetical protein